MDSSQKGGQKRSRRPRSAPPVQSAATGLPPVFRLAAEVPRFVGLQAPLTALSAQVKNTPDPVDKAHAAGRMARQLARRGIELREAIGLAENSLALAPDPELAVEVAGWWVEAGDFIRGAAMLQTAVEELRGAGRLESLLLAARLYARAGQLPQALQVARQTMNVAPSDPRAYEIHGSLRFWGDVPAEEAARSYLLAAELREAKGEKSPAFENQLRAFEVAPSSEAAANALADTLRDRGRPGAADEILREHLRHGSAAKRAAFHQRAFQLALKQERPSLALESAFEANLDIELDPDRIATELDQPSAEPTDFESYLVQRASASDEEGQALAEWLLALIDVHVFDWTSDRVHELRQKAARKWALETAFSLSDPEDEAALRNLRRDLGAAPNDELNSKLREEIALRECARGAWGDAFEVYEPLLQSDSLSLRSSALGLIIAGRCRHPEGRARALFHLAKWLPGSAGAVAYAVASETLVAHGNTELAWQAAARAVECDPQGERALASQALVALSAPEVASAELLEQSLSVLVARGEASLLLCKAAQQRGSSGLGLTWAARALSLRPSDEKAAAALVSQAVLSTDVDKIAEVLQAVLEINAPAPSLAPFVAQALRALRNLDSERAEELGKRVLRSMGVRSKEVVDALIELAKECSAPSLLAAITERQLVSATGSDRAGLSLALARQRLSASQTAAAARALRRALAQGADRSLVEEAMQDFDHTVEPDGKLAILEIEAELSRGASRESDLIRADALRHLGAARWDMAQDVQGAVNLWLKAAELDPDKGLEYLAHYLHHIAGAEAAASHLKKAASQTEDPKRSARLLGLAAYELFELNMRDEAFDLSRTALQRAPLMTELLSIAEACTPEHRLEELLELYDLLADAALGCYGERAVHYRAARQLEKRGLPEKALSHACAAFEAVPAEGVAFVLMARLADSTAGHAALVASLERAADTASNDEERARWLGKAGELADTESIGRRQRVDILLRAAQMLPEQQTLTALLDAIAHFLADDPKASDEMWEKFLRIANEALRDAAGAHGAQLALTLGAAGLTHFDKPEFSLGCLNQAIRLNREIPEYENLLPLANQLSGLPQQAMQFVEETRVLVEQDTMLLGRGLALLSGKIAALLGEPETQTELLVRAACDFPEDTGLISLAREHARKSGRDDLLRLVEGLLPVTERARSILERLEGLTAEEGLDELLTLDLDAAPADLRARLLEALGQRQEELGRSVDAAASFRELYELEPENDIALRGIERDADESGNYEELSRILRARIRLADDPGISRRLSLRRAAVLETKLGRGAEARELLAAMVAETNDLAALRMLADSWERAGDPGEAAELWLQVHKVAEDTDEADDAAYRAAMCFSESGVARRAIDALQTIKQAKVEHRKLGLLLARSLGDKEAIRRELVGLARVTVGDNKLVEQLYLEAAQIALGQGDYEKAESAAKGARLAFPQSAPARLTIARLRILRGGMRTEADAVEILRDLQNSDGISAPLDIEMLEYCRAQALRLAESDAAARKHLERVISHHGARGLVALGLAELSHDEPNKALELYDVALGADLQRMKSEGEVLLAAGEIARAQGDLGRARAFASAVSDDDPMRVRAVRELEEIALEQARVKREEREKKLNEERVAQQEAQAAERLRREQAARETAASEAQEKREREMAVIEAKAAEESPHGYLLEEGDDGQEMKSGGLKGDEQERLRAQRDAIREAARAEHRAATAAVADQEELAPQPRRSSIPLRRASHPPDGLENALIGASMAPQKVPEFPEELEVVEDELVDETALAEIEAPIPDGLVVPGTSSSPPAATLSDSEPASYADFPNEQLVEAFEKGSVGAGRQLFARMLEDRSRSRDAVVVAQHLVALRPGDKINLGLLVTAASRDGNIALASAVRHVIGAYGAGEPVAAPSAEELIDDREAAVALIKQGGTSPLHEALSIVWEHCHSLYRKDLTEYGISGVQRVPLSAPTPLGQLYRSSARVLGLTRTAVFRLPGQDEIALQLGLLSPPAVIVSGDITEVSPELDFHFGAMLAGAIPEHALLFGLAPSEVRYLFEALALSFGSGRPGGSERPHPEVTRVAGYLWETIPSRAQRRLSQICKEPRALDYQAVAASSRRVLRRAGLLACGDIRVAVFDACGEAGINPPVNLPELADSAARSPAVADLLGLALSPEYAELRFRRKN